MKKASVHDLRYRFPEIERLLREGEEIEITKRKRVIARMLPARPSRPALPRLPDFVGRMKRIFGNRVMRASGADVVARDRERF